jgi:hypothetical protein
MAVDFVLAVVGAQRMAGKFLLPLMPFAAIAVARGVVNIPWPRARFAGAVAVGLLGLHHWIAASFLFPTAFDAPGVQFQGSTAGMHLASLANHHSFYLDWAKSGGADPRVDFKIGETLDRVDALGLVPGSTVVVLAEHVFASASSYQLESGRRRRQRMFWNPPGMRNRERPAWLDEHVKALTEASAVIVRSNPAHDGVSKEYVALFDALNDGEKFDFAPVGAPLTLGDGSFLAFYRCRPSRDPAVARLAAAR